MSKDNVTDQLCAQCLELLEDCTCPAEEPRVQDWEDHPFQPVPKETAS